MKIQRSSPRIVSNRWEGLSQEQALCIPGTERSLVYSWNRKKNNVKEGAEADGTRFEGPHGS